MMQLVWVEISILFKHSTEQCAIMYGFVAVITERVRNHYLEPEIPKTSRVRVECDIFAILRLFLFDPLITSDTNVYWNQKLV